MTQQEYAALAVKATAKKNTFAQVVTQSGTNAVNIEGHTGVLTTLLVQDPAIPGIYTTANAPATPAGYVRLEGGGSVAFMGHENAMTNNVSQAIAQSYVAPDGYAIPSLEYINFLIENNMTLSAPFNDAGNWWHWTSDTVASGLTVNVANLFGVNPIGLEAPNNILNGARLRLIYVG